MSTMNRRQFMTTTSAIAAAGVFPLKDFSFSDQSNGGEKMKVGLYSITFLGMWYRGRALTLQEVVDRAKKYNYDGIEIDGKRPHGNPLDWSARRCRELVAHAKDKGIEIYSVAANNDFSSPIPEFRESQIAYVKELIRMAHDFEVKAVRMFLAWPGVTKHPQVAKYSIARDLWQTTHEHFTDEETWSWCREGMIEAAKYAEDFGIILALQNHAPVIRDYKDVLRMVTEVDSPNLKACLDVPIMKDKRPENIRKAASEVGSLQVLSHFGGEYEREADGSIKGEAFYPVFVEAMKEIGYTGYIGYELCHPLPIVNGQTVGIEYAEKNAQLACEYMRGLINS